MAFNGGRGDLEAARQFHQEVQRGGAGRGGRGGGLNSNRGPLNTPSHPPYTDPTPMHGSRGGSGGTASPNQYFQNINATTAQAERPATTGDAGDPMIMDDVPTSPKRGLSASPWATAPDREEGHAVVRGPVARNNTPATINARGILGSGTTAAINQQTTVSAAHGTASSGSANGLGKSIWANKQFNPKFGVDTGPYVDNDWMYTYTIEDGGRLFSGAADNARAAGDYESEAKLRQVAKLCAGVVHARVNLQDQDAELQARTSANKAAKQAYKEFEKYKAASRNNNPKIAEAVASVHNTPPTAAQRGPQAAKPAVQASTRSQEAAQGAQASNFAVAQVQSSQQQDQPVQQSAKATQGMRNDTTGSPAGPAAQGANARSQAAAEQWIRDTFFNKQK